MYPVYDFMMILIIIIIIVIIIHMLTATCSESAKIVKDDVTAYHVA